MEARLELRDRLNLLIKAAGNPTLDTIAAHAATLAEPGSEAPVPGGGTISAWTTKNPRRARFWDSLRWVLEYLIERAKARGEAPDPPDLYLMRRWKRLYEQSAEPTTTTVYQGLAAFQRANADMFYGRDTEIDALVAVLGATVLDEAPGIVAVVAPSGAGKSSLLQAGLLPALEERGLESIPDSTSWPTLVITPGQHPLTSIAAAIPELDGVFTTDEDPTVTAQTLARARAAVRSHLTDNGAPTARLVLIVDQFEEVFTLAAEAERRTFIDLLGSISECGSSEPPPALVVLGMRADFSHNCFGYPPLEDALQNRQRLLPAMTISQLTEAIEGPAAAGGVKVEPALVHLLLQDAGLINADGSITGRSDSGILPLLSHALRITWDRRRAGRGPMSAKGYLDVGRLRGAVQQTADEAWNTLPEQQQEAGLWILLNLVHIGADPSRDTRKPRKWHELLNNAADHDAAQRARDVLVHERLLTADTDTVQITHEALMRSWPRLANAINNHRDGLSRRQRVEEVALAWEQSQNPRWWRRVGAGHNPDLLWRGEELAGALAWAREATDLDRPSTLGQQFLRHSAQRRRRRTSLVMGVIGLLLLTTLTALFEAGAATTERNNAIFTQVVAEADRLSGTDTSLAAQLYLTAYRMNPNPTLASALLNTEASPLSSVLTGHDYIVRSIAYSPTGKIVASSDDSGVVRVWDVSNPDRAAAIGGALPGHQLVHTIAFSPDGHTLITGGSDKTVQLWDVSDPAHPRPEGDPLSFPETVQAVAVSARGLLAVGGGGGSVWLWNLVAGQRPAPVGAPLPGTSADVRTVAFSHDGSMVAAGSVNGRIQLWELTDPARPVIAGPPLTQHGVIDTVEFSPDDHILASAGSGQQVQLWNIADPIRATAVGGPLIGHSNTVFAVTFSPDGHILASASGDNTIRLYNVSDPSAPALLGTPLVGHSGGADAIEFSPDGQTLASGSADHTVRLWHMPTVLTGYTSTVAAVALNPTGSLLATGAQDDLGIQNDSVRLLDFSNPDQPQPLDLPLPAQIGSIDTVAFSPDGHMLAAAGTAQTVWIWDITDPHHARLRDTALRGHQGAVYQLAFSPDGHTLASAGADQTVRLWAIGGLTDGQPPTPAAILTPNTHTGPLNPRVRDDGVGALAFSPDGHTLATGAQENQGLKDYRVRLWDVTDLAHVEALGDTPTDHTSFVSALAFSPDGRILVSSSADHTLRLWNVDDRRRPRSDGEPLRAKNSVTSVAVSPDGLTLASGGDDHALQLWSIADIAHPIPQGRPLTGHAGPVRWVAFSHDGHTLLSASRDATVRVWHPSISAAIDRICASTANTFSPEQWNQYVSPDMPYEPPCRDLG